MSQDLIDAIRDDLVSESVDLSNTLRKAKILATKIGLPEFRDWINYEQAGYPKGAEIPSYRSFGATNLGTFLGPLGRKVENFVLPTYNLPDHVREFAVSLVVHDGVGALQAMLASEHESFQLKWPQEYVLLARHYIPMEDGSQLADAHQLVPSHIVSGVLDNIKNRLLDFILALQDINVTSEELDKGTVETETVRNVFHVNVYGNNNVVASGEAVHQEISTVQKGDMDSLVRYLQSLNVESNDIGKLKNAIALEPNASNGAIGPKVREWVGGMISKAGSTTWRIAVGEAATGLMGALNSYYGLS